MRMKLMNGGAKVSDGGEEMGSGIEVQWRGGSKGAEV